MSLRSCNAQLTRFFPPFSSGYTCALQKDILYQGRMFVSDHWICFHSKVFGKDTKVPVRLRLRLHGDGAERRARWLKCENDTFGCVPPDEVLLGQIAIPVMSVAHIKKTKTAILVPNALVIATARDKVRRSRLRNQDWEKNERVILIRLFFCGFCPVRVCVLPVPRQHLQNPDVHLSSSGGRTDAPPPHAAVNV